MQTADQFDFDDFVKALGAVVPPGTILRSLGPGIIAVEGLDGMEASFGVSASLARGEIAGAIEVLLSSVQDDVVVTIRKAWPESHNNLAMPMARVEHGAIHAWYGSEDEVVVEVGVFPIRSS